MNKSLSNGVYLGVLAAVIFALTLFAATLYIAG